MHIAIVGHKNVGKTTWITEAFRRMKLSPPTVETDESGVHGERQASLATHFLAEQAPLFFTVEIRTARPILKTDVTQDLVLYELDLATLDMDGEGIQWPACVPSLSAIALCYDQGVDSSWNRIEDFQRRSCLAHDASSLGADGRVVTGLRDKAIPFLCCACKAAEVPRPTEIPPLRALQALSKVVQLSLETQAGKTNFHQAFSYLVREAYNYRHGHYSASSFDDERYRASR